MLHPDPIAEAVHELIDDGIGAERCGRRIDVLDEVRHAFVTALKVLAVAQDASPVGVRVSDKSTTVVAAWVAPDLVVCESSAKGRRMVVRYPLPRLLPSGYLLNRQDEPNPQGTLRWHGPLPAEVIDAFAKADLVIH
jgi:hypothetical protein